MTEFIAPIMLGDYWEDGHGKTRQVFFTFTGEGSENHLRQVMADNYQKNIDLIGIDPARLMSEYDDGAESYINEIITLLINGFINIGEPEQVEMAKALRDKHGFSVTPKDFEDAGFYDAYNYLDDVDVFAEMVVRFLTHGTNITYRVIEMKPMAGQTGTVSTMLGYGLFY